MSVGVGQRLRNINSLQLLDLLCGLSGTERKLEGEPGLTAWLTFQWDLTALSCFEAVSAVTTVSGETAGRREEREGREGRDHHHSGTARQLRARTNENFCRAVLAVLSSQAANSADVIGVFSNIDQGKYTILTQGAPPPVSLKYLPLSQRNDQKLPGHLRSPAQLHLHIEAGSHNHDLLGAVSFY